MCGILGILSSDPTACSPEAVQSLSAWRDRLSRRGPDGAGLTSLAGQGGWSAALAHRRLAVIEPGLAGAQPMASPCGRWVIVYNGELYNDAEVRAEVGDRWRFRTRSDTETVMAAVAAWGVEAASRLRGMYAFAVVDARSGRAWLARDPMGIKPLFVAEREGGLFFSSDARTAGEWFTGRGGAGGRAYADPAGVAAYLTTIRTTLGSRTMYQGVRTLRPGEWLTVDLVGGRVATRSVVVPPRDVTRGSASGEGLRAVVEQSVRAHLRSDVPLCCLLSGGLDSTIIATIAQRELGGLHTYCAGAIGDGPRGEDFGWAAQVASRLGTTHREVGVTRGLFAQRVPEMIQAMGVPLSTPNEVAIHEVARAMRADGKVVTLSGEGADELFGGYDQVLAQAASFEALLGETPFACVRDRARHSASFWLSSHAWVGEAAIARVLTAEAHEASGSGLVRAEIEAAFLAIEEDLGDRPGSTEFSVERHLRYQRRVNLEGLLRRLDTATMLASVEGRTPLADAVVCAAAERLPAGEKIHLRDNAGTFATGEPAASKIALRKAFAGLVPEGVLTRAKASFPLPFDRWIADLAPRLRESTMLREMVRPEVLDVVANAPGEHWRISWPLANLAIWGETLATKATGFVEAAADVGVPAVPYLGTADAA